MTAPFLCKQRQKRPARFRILRPETWLLLQSYGLTVNERLVFLFLEAGPYTHFSGLFTCAPVDLAIGAGLSEREARTALSKLTSSGLVIFDPTRFLLFIPGLAVRQLGTDHFNVKHRAGMLAQLARLPKKSPAVQVFIETYGGHLGLSSEGQAPGTPPDTSSDTICDTPPETPSSWDADGSERGEGRREKREKNLPGIPFEEIIAHLNRKARANFRPTTKTTQSFIKARWLEGWREKDFFKVIDDKVNAWGTDPKMAQYLRPETLFGTKFEGYANVAQPEWHGTDTAGRPLMQLPND